MAGRRGVLSPLDARDRGPTDGEDDGNSEGRLGDQIATSLKRALTKRLSSRYVRCALTLSSFTANRHAAMVHPKG
jgi:hypothetical protein